MSVKVPLLLLLLLAAAAGFLFGTENGRSQREVIMVKLGRGDSAGDLADAASDAVSDAADAATDAVSDAADAVADATS